MSWWSKYSLSQMEEMMDFLFQQTQGGGSSASLIHQASRTLNNDEIKALRQTPISIVASPGSNKKIIGMSSTFHARFADGSYGNIADGANLWIGTSDALFIAFGWFAKDVAESVTSLSDFLGIAQNATFELWPPAGGASVWGITPFGHTDLGAVDKGLSVCADNAGADFNGGHANNSLIVSVTYLVLDMATGVYE